MFKIKREPCVFLSCGRAAPSFPDIYLCPLFLTSLFFLVFLLLFAPRLFYVFIFHRLCLSWSWWISVLWVVPPNRLIVVSPQTPAKSSTQTVGPGSSTFARCTFLSLLSPCGPAGLVYRRARPVTISAFCCTICCTKNAPFLLHYIYI